MVELTLVSCATSRDILVDGGICCKDVRLLREKEIAIRRLKTLKRKSEHGHYETGLYCHHYLFKENIICLTICTKYFPTKLSSLFLEEVSQKFIKMRGTKTDREMPLQSFRSTIEQANKSYTSSTFQINNWSLIARSSDGIKLVQISDDEWKQNIKEKYTKKAINLFLKKNAAMKQSVVMGPYSGYCLSVGDISYMSICSKHYPSELVFEYLELIRNEFESQYHNRVHYARVNDALCAFGRVMKQMVNLYWDTRSERFNNGDADDAYVENVQGDVQQVDDDVLKSLRTCVSDHESVELSSPLKTLDDNIQVAQLIEKKNGEETYFRMGADNGRSFKLHLDIYQGLFLHQRQGLKWLWSLHCQGKGAILADDMGLGKTRLVLAFLVGLFHSQVITNALIVVPKTLVEQWEAEVSDIGLERISRIYTNAESHEGGLKYISKQGGLMICSYPVLEKHHSSVMGQISWDYMFFDEGHKLKNCHAQTPEILNAVQCSHKIIVTGTPVQNNLLEFYALVNLCNPGLLGTELIFRERFALPIQRGKHKDATSAQKRLAIKVSKELHKVVEPYMLRRTKQILRESGQLPEKHELTVWLKMTPVQVRLYEAFLKIPNYKISGAGLAAAQVARYICNHPLILKHGEPGKKRGLATAYMKRLLQSIAVKDDISSSCKISFMLHLVRVLLEQNHKILIFSQSREMLKLAERALVEGLKLGKNKIIRMDGDTPQDDRDIMINAFQPDEDRLKKASLKKASLKKATTNKQPDCRYENPQIFLMTTYVGGVGLNLTNATRVIILDPARNPSWDIQSVDRAYRLGQEKNVIVYRLVTCGTIEEHTYREQILKGELFFAVTENKHCERSMLEEKHRVLIPPEGGYDQSDTQFEIQEQFGYGFGPDIRREVRYLRNHESVFDFNNHSLLFTLEENLPLTPEIERLAKKGIGRHVYPKNKAEIVTDGQSYALKPLSEKWAQYKGPVLATNARTRVFPIKKSLGSVLSNNRREGAKARGTHSVPGECSSQGDRQCTPAAGPSGVLGESSREGSRQHDPGKLPK